MGLNAGELDGGREVEGDRVEKGDEEGENGEEVGGEREEDREALRCQTTRPEHRPRSPIFPSHDSFRDQQPRSTVNGRCTSPGHLWLTGCQAEMEIQLKRLPGFDKWIIEKENLSYIEAFQDRKEHLVYLTADSENILDELDLTKTYIVGGLVDRNRWKGITMKKAKEQGIQTAKLPIGDYLKMSSSQVLTVNQVIEILLKFLETRDWKTSFFQVIPQRKRCEADSEEYKGDSDPEENEDQLERKRKFVESPPHC